MTAVDDLSALLPPGALGGEDRSVPALGRPPEAVVHPSTAAEVATLMGWASRECVGVLPIASGRRADPVARDDRYVVLATDRLSGIDEYEAADLTVTAGAGTPFATVAESLAEHRQWAPFDPPSVTARSLGGLVAAGESGPLRMGYGDVRHHVLGLTVVTGDGRTLHLGGRVVKNVAGYDVVKAVVGSRGTLAVITAVCIRAFPRPPVDRVLMRTGSSLDELIPHGLDVGTAPVLPASSVIVDRLEAAGGAACLVVRLHGARATVDAEQRRLEDHVGFSFETLGDVGVEAGDGVAAAETREVLNVIADHATAHEAVAWASALPTRLENVVHALRRHEPETIAVDTYSGWVRAGTSVARLDGFEVTRGVVEAMGGAVRVQASGAADLLRTGSVPTDGEVRLIEGLRSAFDPEGVLWPARR